MELAHYLMIMFVCTCLIGIIGLMTIFIFIINCFRRQRLEDKRLSKLEAEDGFVAGINHKQKKGE